MVLAWSEVFSPQCKSIWETTLVKMYCVTMATSKVDAETPVSTRLQLSPSIAYMRGSPSIKCSPSLKGNTRRWWGLFLPTHTAIFYVQRNDWYTLGHSSREMLRSHFHVNSHAQEEMVAHFEPPRLSVATCSNEGECWTGQLKAFILHLRGQLVK